MNSPALTAKQRMQLDGPQDLEPPPGPYESQPKPHACELDGFPTTGVSIHSQGRAIALVYGAFGDGPKMAQLLARAPEMREALRAIYAAARHPEEGQEGPDINALRGAIRSLARHGLGPLFRI